MRKFTLFLALAFLTCLSARVQAQQPKHPLIEKDFDPRLRAGDLIEVSCVGDFKTRGYLRMGSEDRWDNRETDRFSVSGTLWIEADNVREAKFNHWVRASHGELYNANSERYRKLSIYGLVERSLISVEGEDAIATFFPKDKVHRAKCSFKKVDPIQPRVLIGSFVWKYPTMHTKQLFFQSRDEKFDDGQEYSVLGTDAAFDQVRKLIGKQVNLVGKISTSSALEIDDKNLSLKEVPALCNISRTYNVTTGTAWNGGIRTFADQSSYYLHGVPFSSVSEAQKEAKALCEWWNAFPEHTGIPGRSETWITDYKCEAVCK